MPTIINGTTGIDKVQDGSITSSDLASGAALANIGANGVTAAYLDTQSQYTGFKNRIINGAMMIDQRNAGAAATFAATGGYSLDRWRASNGVSTCTVQQTTTAPTGFKNSLLWTVSTTDNTSNASHALQHFIEGNNVYDLMLGTANAATFTLSFWVRSSLVGLYGIGFCNEDESRSYVGTYTINAANTWEQKTITVAGDTSGTWDKSTGRGLILNFDLGSGSNYNTTAGSWQTGGYRRTSGCVNLANTSGATFYITGVQLEKGSTATSFDYRPYGTELALCQRYYDFLSGGIGTGNQTSSTNCGFSLSFRVPKRAAPTPSLVGTVNANDGTSQVNISSLPSYFYGDTNGILINLTTASLTANRPTLIYSTSSSVGLALSAEL